jgi:hypothetical protein
MKEAAGSHCRRIVRRSALFIALPLALGSGCHAKVKPGRAEAVRGIPVPEGAAVFAVAS